jgi:small-conductance mechanosensitive channel
MDFFVIKLIRFGTYDILMYEAILMVPLIVAVIYMFRLFNRLVKKRQQKGKNTSKVISIIVRIALLAVVLFVSLRVLGVKLYNFFDFAGEVLRFRLFTIGDTDVSLLTIVVMAIVVFASTKIARLLRNYFNKTVFPKFKIESGLQSSLSKLIAYIVIAFGIIVALQSMGIKLSYLTVFAGVLGVGIGFGMQSITASFVSGVAILFERQIKEGDMVKVGNMIGTVMKVKLRSSIIRTIDNEHLIVPNTEFVNSTVENMSHSDPKLRIQVDVGVAYGTDPYLVREALLEAANVTEDILEVPEPDVLFSQFGDSSLMFVLRVWIDRPVLQLKVKSELHYAIVDQFKSRGITIPFPQRDIHVKQLPPQNMNG